ncbi:MAG TPA: hypothetical protein VH561_00065 [Micromonosporaceae bacterium]|jgi:hypothetical protein
MKAHLLFQDRDVDPTPASDPLTDAVIQDLELDTLVAAMAGGDPRSHSQSSSGHDDFLAEVARTVLLDSLTDPAEIGYRQAVLRDCLDHPGLVRQLYDLALAGITAERGVYGGYLRHPGTILRHAIDLMQGYVVHLRQLRHLADEHTGRVTSPGFTELFATLARQLDDDYFHTVNQHLRRLRFERGVLISARLGPGSKGVDYTLRSPTSTHDSWRSRLGFGDRDSYNFAIAERDEAGARALSNLRDRGVDLAADALAGACDHIRDFFRMLRIEIGFYLGCVNLHDRLTGKGEPTCLPVAEPPHSDALSAFGLYDASLTLRVPAQVVGNDLDADGTSLLVVTGANQGGKSTLLRSIGQAQLMMQAGMFVPAQYWRARICTPVLTHYRREEDATMTRGKLDEELYRMSEIADRLRPGALMLCNESFASTNEREGSEIGRQVIHALTDAGVRVVLVTHLHDLAQSLYAQASSSTLFLRAQRRADGTRTFRIEPGQPLPTSYGRDLYADVFR